MLSQLHIENIAVIEKADISFPEGFTVLTGETGAGKSILIDSINILLGERAARDLIRQGCTKAVVSAVFDNISPELSDILNEYGLESDENCLIIQRNISSDGKSASRINGRQVTLNILKEIGRTLVNFHGQHENNNLLDSSFHVRYLDAYAKNDIEKAEYKDAYLTVKELEKTFDALNMDEREKAYKTELFRYQIDEIEKASLVPANSDGADEEEILNRDRNIAANRNRIIEGLESARNMLSENDENASDLMFNSLEKLSGISKYDDVFAGFADRLNEIYENLVSLNDDLRDYMYGNYSDSDYLDIDEIEMRLDLIYRLKRKYGGNISEILDFAEKCRAELDDIEFSAEKSEKLSAELNASRQILKEKAKILSDSRKKAAKLLEMRVQEELKFLEMPNVRFSCSFEMCSPKENGSDVVEFLMSANLGEPLRSMTKIASGGELSRIMLSIKKVLSSTENVGTLIFDEIDTGVSGRAAQKIAIKLREMAADRQVIVVTHLTQIAALGNNHFLISKNTNNGRTFTDIIRLSREERRLEIARMLGGLDITEAMLSTAEEMLDMAENIN